MIFHCPVLVAEVIHYMRLQPGETYVDCTVGGGGHLLRMVESSPTSRFIGIDMDPDAIGYAQKMLGPYRRQCTLIKGNFINIDLILKELSIQEISGCLFDCGVSYHQVTTPARGFSYDYDGPLLMRMSPDMPTLQERLRSTSQRELAYILRTYGDVRSYRKIADLMYTQRRSLHTTAEIRAIVEQVIPKRYHKKNCRRVFQALRIWVNDELGNLAKGLDAAFEHLGPGGRLVTIAYHSGEDRIVKHFFRERQRRQTASVLTKGVIRPSEDEIKENPRARSARLRACERCA
jgi:16S rRNA (cytosine1402-N4)-methyltransferase